MEGLLLELLTKGGMPVITVIAIIIAFRKDQHVTMLYDRYVEKCERDAEKYHELAQAQTNTMRELTDAIDHQLSE